MHTGDWGKMEAPPWFKKLDGIRNNLTWLTHWGIYDNRSCAYLENLATSECVLAHARKHKNRLARLHCPLVTLHVYSVYGRWEQMGGSECRRKQMGGSRWEGAADGRQMGGSKCRRELMGAKQIGANATSIPAHVLHDVVVPVITPMNRLPVFGHEKSPLHPAAQNVPPKDKVGSAQLDSACARMCVCVCVCLCVCVRVGVCAHAQALISPINKRSNH
eukprot:1153699-Pelagomonas_calceolata.AAC.6